MPTPRSNPSAITYMATATASSPAQISGSQKARPSYSIPKPNMLFASYLRRLRPVTGRPSRPSSGTESGRFGFLAEVVAAHVLDRIGPAPQELGEIIGAEAEHEGIDDEEGQERRGHRTRGYGRDRVGRAQVSVDHIGLTADLGGEPAEEHGAEARGRHDHRRREERPVGEQRALHSAGTGSTGRCPASRSRCRP